MHATLLGATLLGDGRHALPDRIKHVLQHLHLARQTARNCDCDIWDFAVDVPSLREFGVSFTDCRWMICVGYVKQAIETTLVGDPCRSFRAATNLYLTPQTCLVLTDEGSSYLESVLTATESENATSRIQLDEKPIWDRQRNELWYGETLVKKYKLPASNQATVLQAFEEDGWPARIDDPLPPKPNQDSKRRLHDTINSLNRNQRQRSLKFTGDGTGHGVCWEPLS